MTNGSLPALVPRCVCPSPGSSLQAAAGRVWPHLASVPLPGSNLTVTWGFPTLFGAEITDVWIIWLHSRVCFVLFLMLIGGPTLSRLVVGCSWVGVSCEQDGSEPPGRVTVSLSLNTGEHRPLLQDASLCFFLFPAVLVCYTRWDVVRANGTVCHRCDWNQGWKHVPCFD